MFEHHRPGGIQRPEVQFLMGRTQNFFFVPHTRHEEKNLFLCKWLNMSFTHLRNIPNEKFFWFFSCGIHHLKFRSKVTECPAKHPLYTSTNKLKRNGLLTVVYFYSQANQVLYKVCNWLQCWQEKRNFKQNYFHRNYISFIHFKCS